MTGPIISVRNVTFCYEKIPVLNNVSVDIHAGDFVGVTGSNGAGKSTLIKLLLGQLDPASGTISILGKERQNFRGWPAIGYVPQMGFGASADFPATVREVVMLNLYSEIGLFRLPDKAHKRRVLDTLKLVGMEHCLNCRLGSLSGGQQQRVMLAKALVGQPGILLLDEPASGIDAHSTKQFIELLARLNEQGMTIIMVTHHLGDVSNYMNRILLLRDQGIHESAAGERHGDF